MDVEHWKCEERPYHGRDSAEDIYRLASDPVRQATDQRNYEYVQDMRKEQKRKNPGGIHSDVVKISYRESHHNIIENIFTETQAHRGEDAPRIALDELDQTIARVGLFLDLLLDRKSTRLNSSHNCENS